MAPIEKTYQGPNVECGYIYDPDKGGKIRKVLAETSFQDLFED